MGTIRPAATVFMAFEGNKSYYNTVKEAKEKGAEHNQGPPYITTFVHFIQGVGLHKKLDEEQKLSEFYESEVKNKSMEDLADNVKHCRLAKCYKKAGKKQMYRITFHLANWEAERRITACCKQTGGIRKVGPPPRAALA